MTLLPLIPHITLCESEKLIDPVSYPLTLLAPIHNSGVADDGLGPEILTVKPLLSVVSEPLRLVRLSWNPPWSWSLSASSELFEKSPPPPVNNDDRDVWIAAEVIAEVFDVN